MARLPDRLTAIGLATRFRTGEETPAAATEALLEAIAARDGHLGAYQAVYAEEARMAAEAATAAIRSGHRIGPLHGVPFALKDIVDLEGRVTTWGSSMLADRVAPATGTLARRLFASGAVLLGKTKTVEAAFGGWGTNEVMGTPRNPSDDEAHRAPGGSSSGSGVAVAAGFAPFAIGTDTGGSVRLPAAFCGIVGLKVTEGVLPTDGIMPLSHTLDTPGPMTRSVRDAALVFEVLRGRDPVLLDREIFEGGERFAALDRGVRGMVLGRPPESELEIVAPEIRALYEAALERLAAEGAEIVPVPPMPPAAELSARTLTIIAAESWIHHGERFADEARPADPYVRARVLSGRDVRAEDYIRILVDRQRLRAQWLEDTRGIDAVLTPTVPYPAPRLDEIDQDVSPGVFTRPGNYLGLCGLSVPIGRTGDGLPAGLQVTAAPHAEWTALRIGAAVEAGAP